MQKTNTRKSRHTVPVISKPGGVFKLFKLNTSYVDLKTGFCFFLQ